MLEPESESRLLVVTNSIVFNAFRAFVRVN